ncbi:zinc dependent phospholipase C family protein [Tepidibacillus fermentans]|uniref:Zinc dependent phospholipase C n=1 Tax=Tepidibacillus fermentans TaxID=1281767 RepID=A0A4R3KKE8_9BACI|nr:zinc dependent phospholipase C family protein [Tepidibacillus fermentans]TCS84194.1 zinc dependent phospholipase C [Tepidibacillus fermentans]
MPNDWTHLLFWERVAAQSGIYFSSQQKEFQLGTQGPDHFFYYYLWPWKKKDRSVIEIGTQIHKEHCGKFLLHTIDYLKENPNPILKAYVYGFISHHILDRNPYIFIV